jgi:hypothetical protein
MMEIVETVELVRGTPANLYTDIRPAADRIDLRAMCLFVKWRSQPRSGVTRRTLILLRHERTSYVGRPEGCITAL